MAEYGWPEVPLAWADAEDLIAHGLLTLIATENGLVLQRPTQWQTLEWLAVFLPDSTPEALHRLLTVTDPAGRQKPHDWAMINWAMTGCQSAWARYATRHGFRLAAQVELVRDNANPLTQPVFQAGLLRRPPQLSAGVTCQWIPGDQLEATFSSDWLDELATQTVQAFAKAPDPEWDLRFRDPVLMHQLLREFHTGEQGQPLGVMLLITTSGVLGACWALRQTVPQRPEALAAHIPLVWVQKGEQRQGLGYALLVHTILQLERLYPQLTQLAVTTSSDMPHVIRLYRQLAFKEQTCYPMAYLPAK